MPQLSVYQAHQFHLCSERQSAVALAEDVMAEYISESFFSECYFRHGDIIASEWYFVLQVHPRHHGIDAFLVHLCEAEAQVSQEEMTRMLGIVKVVGIVHYALYVALIVAHDDLCLENVVHYFIEERRDSMTDGRKRRLNGVLQVGR